MKKISFLLLLFIGFFSCKEEDAKEIAIAKIPVTVKINRFDVDFYTADSSSFPLLKKKYPLLFPTQVADSVWLSKIKDKDEQELFAETQKVFKNSTSLKKELQSLFKHIKYYHPQFKEPKVITLLTNIDYDNRVIYADSLLLISLDVYLGKNHPFYGDYPKYIKENNQKSHIVVDVANAFIKKQLPLNSDRTFIGKMIFEGKKLYLLDRYLPKLSEKEKIGYEEEKLAWAKANEEQIWKYFIEKKLLFSTDSNLDKRFIAKAPFSKFYLSEDNKSPGKIGAWVGWQIVRSYMQHNDVSLQQLMQTKALDIYKKSKYKPRK